MPAAKIDIKFGRRTKSLAKYSVTFPQIVFAQLVAVGFEPSEAAWVVNYGFNKLVTDEQLVAKGKLTMKSEKITKLIEHFKSELATSDTSEAIDSLIARKISEDGEMGADATAAELLRMAQSMPDGKERADLMMKYADLKGFKKGGSDTKADKKQVAFFLPPQCSTCPCYQYAMENGGEDKKPLHSSRV